MTLQNHSEYWRDVADHERKAGNDRLSEDYERMADAAESWYQLGMSLVTEDPSSAGREAVG